MPAAAARPAASSWRAMWRRCAPRRPGCSGSGWSPSRPAPAGLPVERVYVESGSEIARELYLSLTLNRERGRIAVVASAAGGMDIEEVAEQHAGADPVGDGASGHRTAALSVQAARLRPGTRTASRSSSSRRSLLALYRLYLERDASLIEINPLIVTRAARWWRSMPSSTSRPTRCSARRSMAALRDPGQEDPMERRASEHDLNYVSLDGDIACMVNGAGLAMATMDLIKLHGGTAGQLPRRRRRRDQRARHRGVSADPVQSATCARSWSTSSAASCAAT